MNIKDIAKLSGVSTTTVSRVLNSSPNVSDRTRKLVLSIIDEHNYIPNSMARNLHNEFANKIGVIVADITNEFFSSAIRGISKVAYKNSIQILFYNTDEDLKEEAKALYSIFEERLSGLIISPVSSVNKDTLEKLKRLTIDKKTPVVLLDRDIEGIELDAIFVDNKLGSKKAVESLIKEGHRDIAIITGPIHSTPGNQRFKGYIEALEENDIEIKEEYIALGDFKTEGSYYNTKKLMELKNPPSAIFSSNNLTTLGCLKYLNEKKLVLGRDISVIGFDQIHSFDAIGFPFSYVSRDSEKQGELAAEILLDRIEDNIMKKSKRLIMDCKLNLNGSEKNSFLKF